MEIGIAAGPMTNQKEKAFIYAGSTAEGGFFALNMINSIIKGSPIETSNAKTIIDWRMNLFFLYVLKSLMQLPKLLTTSFCLLYDF